MRALSVGMSLVISSNMIAAESKGQLPSATQMMGQSKQAEKVN